MLAARVKRGLPVANMGSSDMTKQESFKRRIRERMAKTGERYAAARRVLLEQAASQNRRRVWHAEPEMSNEAIINGTGRGWDDWCDLIDARPAGIEGHTAIATYVRDDLSTDPWWSQGVTVGYERITGLRLPYERPDGTFTASKSKTVVIDPAELRSMLLDDDRRDDLFPGFSTVRTSAPDSKTIVIEIGAGVTEFRVSDASDSADGARRAKVSVQHSKLPAHQLVEEWKFYWADWLKAIDGA